MSNRSKIEWTDATWNPLRGCTRVSRGCEHCYAERMAARGLPGLKSPTTGDDFATPGGWSHKNGDSVGPRWTGRVELIESQLEIPLHWRKPRRIFVNSTSDTFHELVSDEAIQRIYAVEALCLQHTFLHLTKRPKRRLEFFVRIGWRLAEAIASLRGLRVETLGWRCWLPLPNVWEGVSVEDQATADERIPLLVHTPASLRFLSVEPLLGPVDLAPYLDFEQCGGGARTRNTRIDWVIVGGESGPGARPCNVEWIRDIVRQCAEAGVPCFVKQVGSNPCGHFGDGLALRIARDGLRDRKGADPSEWPADLRVRQMPEVRR